MPEGSSSEAPVIRPGPSDFSTLRRLNGSRAELVQRFSRVAATLFGSGWTWLIIQPDGSLAVETTANQDTPLTVGHRPILGLDVWEHAYYLRYRNRRVDYIAAWWQVVDWGAVADRYRTWLNE